MAANWFGIWFGKWFGKWFGGLGAPSVKPDGYIRGSSVVSRLFQDFSFAVRVVSGTSGQELTFTGMSEPSRISKSSGPVERVIKVEAPDG